YTVVSLIEGTVPDDLPERIVTYILSAGLTFGAGVLTFRIVDRQGFWRWPAVLLTALAALLLHAAVGTAIYVYSPPTPAWTDFPPLAMFSSAVVYNSPVMSSAFLGFAAIHYVRRFAEQQRLTLETAAAARDAQLATLKHQLSPHFLFNTLNSISALVTGGDPKTAEKTIIMLSDFLRSALDVDDSALIPLREELDNGLRYIEIEQIRYESRLQLTTQIDDAAMNWPVPPFLLQPILENIVKHAVAKRRRPVHTALACAIVEGRLAISVEDDGPGLGSADTACKAPTGIGLQNVRQRLSLIYGPNAHMSVKGAHPQGVRIDITIPSTRAARAVDA
ncbi:MAG: histidine kinase, partial [Pseudomonadota bacterium]